MYMTTFGEFCATLGDIVVIPAGVPHASCGGPDSIVTHLYVPRDHAAVREISTPLRIRHSLATSPDEILDAIGSHDPWPRDPMLPARRAP